jgi:DNA-binding transcriptional ArsR family regulator
MVNYSSKQLSRAFAALADPTRREILQNLAAGGISVSRLAETRRVTPAAILKHLRVLEEAGLVQTRKVGRVRQCALTPAPLLQMTDWLARDQALWEVRLDRLAKHLEQSGELR